MSEGYERLEKLCRTAGSDLWRGRRNEDGASVLLKVLPQGAPPAQVAVFRREFEILNSLHIHGVARPLRFVEDPGAVLIVLEDAGGEPLESVLNSRPADLPDALVTAQGLIGIVAGVHGASLVHSDIRPGNFLITLDCRPILVDFHCAALGDGEIKAPEGLGPFPGERDPACLLPEQTGGINRRIDYWSDLYALGVLLYRLLAGRLPLVGEDHDARPPIQYLLQGIIDNSTAVIFAKDLQGRFLLVNRRCRELFQIVPGLTVYDLFSKERADALQASDQRAIEAGTAIESEEEVPQEDGIHTYISIKAPIQNEEGKLFAVCGVSTDITERKKAERYQSAQYAIAGVLAGSATLADAAPRLLQILCESLSWELGEVWIVDAGANLLRHMESWHVPSLESDAFVEGSRGGSFAPGAGLPGRVWQKGEPQWVADVMTDTGFVRAALAADAGLHGALAFPIRLGSRILGVMAFFSREMGRPDEDLLEILATIGNQVGQFMERKRAEEGLRFSESRYRALHRDNPTMIFTLDAEGTILSVNPFGAHQLGYTVEELEGRSVLDVFHQDDRPAIAEQLRNCLANPKEVYRWHLRKIRKDGGGVWVEELARAVYGLEGVLNILVVCQDITERRKAEEDRKKALIEAETARNKINAILESAGDGLLVTDLADQTILMNEAAEVLLGIRLADTSRRHIGSLLAEESLRRQIANVRRGTQEKVTSEWERRDTDDGVRIVQAQTTAVRSAEGRRTGTITILRDITREREIDRMKNEFISTAAHELRTPLTTIMGYLQLLRDGERFTSEERKEFLHLVYEKSEDLERIIRDLLDLSRVQTGKLVTVEKVRDDLARLVRHAVASYQGITDRHLFRLDFPEEAVELCFDSGKIGQVLDNLFSNAVKFSPDGGIIRVSGRRTGAEFQITVADEGIGMRAEEVARMFDKFYRVDASNTAVSGLGLGMSIVKNIVEAHGGRIWAESEQGRGTRVHFTLPVEDPAGECRIPGLG